MRIEKPKNSQPPSVIIVLGVVALLFIIPFIFTDITPAKSVSTTSAPKEIVAASNPQPVPSEKQEKQKIDEPIPQELPLPEPSPVIQSTKKENEEAEKKVKEVTPVQPAEIKNPLPAVLTSFFGDVKIISSKGAVPAKKNQPILEGETIEVGAEGEAVLEIADLYILRLKPATKITQLPPKISEAFSGKNRVVYQFKLDEGTLLGTTKFRGDKTELLDLVVKDRLFNIQDSTFRVQLSDSSPWLGVLRGSVKSNIENVSSKNPIVIRALEKVSLGDQQPAAELQKVSEQEWGLLRETYEMNTKTTTEELHQKDLSKKAGDFFQYVFDHGNFYTESMGYTVRDFYQDPSSGEVYFEAEYDVFSTGSFVGIYVLTRDLDARDFGGIQFDVRRKPDEGYPDRFYIEMKSKGEIIHRFEIADIKPNWETRRVDFFSPASTPIREVTIVFLNESIGDSKKGFIQMKNFNMIPLTPEQIAKRDEYQKNLPVGAATGGGTGKPQSLKQAVVTVPLRQAKKVFTDEKSPVIPGKVKRSKKIADEIPKVVSLDDLSEVS